MLPKPLQIHARTATLPLAKLSVPQLLISKVLSRRRSTRTRTRGRARMLTATSSSVTGIRGVPMSKGLLRTAARSRSRLRIRPRMKGTITERVGPEVLQKAERKLKVLLGAERRHKSSYNIYHVLPMTSKDKSDEQRTTIKSAGNPRKLKLARKATGRRRRLLKPKEAVTLTAAGSEEPTKSGGDHKVSKRLRTSRVGAGTSKRLRGAKPSENRTLIASRRTEGRLRLKLRTRRPKTHRRLRRPKGRSATATARTRQPEEVSTAEKSEKRTRGRRRHRIRGKKRTKRPPTTTSWPPNVVAPTQGPHMGGNPFGNVLTKNDLFLMGKGLNPDWWQDSSVGECPGEHLIVHDSLYFQCSRRNFNDLSDPYGMCLHGDSACKQGNPRSKCCYNGCGDICLTPEKLVHEFCYEAMGAVRYQPGEEFMHGEWWCKCDPKKKSYQEMCTRLKCHLGELVDDHKLIDEPEDNEEDDEEETTPEEDTEEEHDSDKEGDGEEEEEKEDEENEENDDEEEEEDENNKEEGENEEEEDKNNEEEEEDESNEEEGENEEEEDKNNEEEDDDENNKEEGENEEEEDKNNEEEEDKNNEEEEDKNNEEEEKEEDENNKEEGENGDEEDKNNEEEEDDENNKEEEDNEETDNNDEEEQEDNNENNVEEENDEESEDESDKQGEKPKRNKKCKKGSKGCKKGNWKRRCKKGKKCRRPKHGGGKPRRCRKGDPNCKKPKTGGGKFKKCKKGDPNCKRRKAGREVVKCKKGDPNCKRVPGKGRKPTRPGRKCKKGDKKCKWWKRPKRPVKKWKTGGRGKGGWKKNNLTKVRKYRISYKNKWKGKWKGKWRGKWKGKWKGKRKVKKWGKNLKKTWKKGWKKTWRKSWKKGWMKKGWKKGWRRGKWNRWRKSWRKGSRGGSGRKWRRRTTYKVVTKKYKVKWTLGKGNCEQIWVMGCNGMALNEKLALNLMLAIRESHYKWPEDFVRLTNGSAERTELLKKAYLDNYYYGKYDDSLNWLFWVEGLKQACNTSVGDGVYPVTWSSSLKPWQAATEKRLLNETKGELVFAKNWTKLWFDPLRDTCERNVWTHFTERRPHKNVGEFELSWHSGQTIELSTTNMELGWLMRFVPMYRRYIWTLILVGSREGWHGNPQYKILGVYWRYGARRYEYVLRSCYNIWSWGCNGTTVNATWARDWLKYSTRNGFTWPEYFVQLDEDVDQFIGRHDLDWDGLSVFNGTDSQKLNWALWYDAYDAVCNATYGQRSEEKLVDVLQAWKAEKENEFSTATSNVTISGNWSDLWRYTFRHSCISKLKVYRRYAYDLIVKKERHSLMGYWMQKYMKGEWNTAYFQKVKTLTVKDVSWGSYLDLSIFDGYGTCIDTWRAGCNSTLTNSSYIEMWQDLMDRAGFDWSGNFTTRTNSSLVEELVDTYLSGKNGTDLSDYNWAFWFDGWHAMCNDSMEDENGTALNYTGVLHRWATDWTEQFGDDPNDAVDWMKLWVEPLLYMCNYTGNNDTISEDFNNLLEMSPEDGGARISGAIVGKEVRYERVMEQRMKEVRLQRRAYRYDFNYGLCINVWTSVCHDKMINMTEVDGLLRCLQRSTPALDFMNYTKEELTNLLETTSAIDLTPDERRLLAQMKNDDIPDTKQLVWQLWIGSWKSVCAKAEAGDYLALDEVLAALEEDFEANQILQIGGTVDEWKKAWIQPWVGPCKGEAFSCEFEQQYEETGPMTWNFECSVYINGTIQSYNWTSAGNDWKEKCGFDAGTHFDWTDVEQVMKIWTDLCDAGNNDSGTMLPYAEDKWDEDFDIACHKLKIFMDDDRNGLLD